MVEWVPVMQLCLCPLPLQGGRGLEKKLQSRTAQLTHNEGLKINFIENGGLKLKHILARNNPFPTSECLDKICPVCKKKTGRPAKVTFKPHIYLIFSDIK